MIFIDKKAQEAIPDINFIEWAIALSEEKKESTLIRERYARRKSRQAGNMWSPLRPYSMLVRQERERALVRLLNRHLNGRQPADLKAIEIGCGEGANLQQLITLGFSPDKLIGNELLDYHIDVARKRLPASVNLETGDALELDIAAGSLDVVYQSVVFSSILDDDFQEALAKKMWAWLKPGGALLWYDFIYNNPRNPDVRGISIKRVKELFPQGRFHMQRVTLAPPIGRRVTQWHQGLYPALNLFPFLRTHIICWIEK